MTNSEIDAFIKSNTEQTIKDYFNSLILKLDTTGNKNDKLSLIMGILIAFYYILDLKIVSEFDLGPFSITEVSLCKLFIPLIFAYVFFNFAALNAHRAILIKNFRKIGKELYTLEDNIAEETMYSNPFLQQIMPFSFWEEINSKFMHNGKLGGLTILLILPLFTIILIPFAFEVFALITLFKNNWSDGWTEKAVIILTIWLLLAVIVYYVKLMSKSVKDVRHDFASK